jgi:DNA-binding NarL/FixJ family response regulator
VRSTCAHPGCGEPVGRGRRSFCGPEHARLDRLVRKSAWNAARPPRRSRAATVDPVAVLRAVRGEPIDLNIAERRAAIAELNRRGLTAAAIAERVSVSARSVTRHRAAIRQERTA